MRARILKGSFALGITIAMTTGLGSAATAAEDDDVSPGISRLDAGIKCVPIETSFFCTDIGFAPADEDFASWRRRCVAPWRVTQSRVAMRDWPPRLSA